MRLKSYINDVSQILLQIPTELAWRIFAPLYSLKVSIADWAGVEIRAWRGCGTTALPQVYFDTMVDIVTHPVVEDAVKSGKLGGIFYMKKEEGE